MSKKIVECLSPRFRSPYVPFERKDNVSFSSPSRTHQSFKDECNVNLIMSRFEKTGHLPDMIKRDPQYGDFSELPNYQESLHIVMRAEEQFSALSSRVRARFDNDPSKFLDFANNPDNQSEMIDLGLATASSKAPEPVLSPKSDASSVDSTSEAR